MASSPVAERVRKHRARKKIEELRKAMFGSVSKRQEVLKSLPVKPVKMDDSSLKEYLGDIFSGFKDRVEE